MTTDTITSTTRRQQAEGRLLVIRNALAVADEELARAYAEKDWEALGCKSWAAYCAELLPEMKFIKLRPEVRRSRIASLHAAGASRREVAAGSGASLGQVQKEIAAIEGRSFVNVPQPAPVVDQPVSRNYKTDRVVALIAAAGAAGLDVKAVQKELKCERHEASATLTRLHNARRIAYVEPQRRGMFGRYTAVQP